MDSSLVWTAVGSVAGVAALAVTGWQVRIGIADHRLRRAASERAAQAETRAVDGLPVAIPVGRLPTEVRGRDVLLAELWAFMFSRSKRGGRAWVLAGMGGLGKSTVALSVAQSARNRGWRVWWVSAADPASLNGGMLEVLHQLGAPDSVTRPVREGSPVAADRAWAFLNAGLPHGRRWLLIFDNADNPSVLAGHGTDIPADHAGWFRADPAGILLVTTRVKDPGVWGPGISLRELQALDDAAGARVLADLAPGIPDPAGEEARELARRLGGLPLALHLAGSYLASPFARWRTFAEYHRALDGPGLPDAIADVDVVQSAVRSRIGGTWDLSLDALAASGQPQARPLLSLIACYAPAAAIPGELLQALPLSGLAEQVSGNAAGALWAGTGAGAARLLREGLRGLAVVGLTDIADSGPRAGMPTVVVHPVVADVTRSRILTAAPSVLQLTVGAAVTAMETVTAGLDEQEPADWPAWRMLTPHVTALLEWAARLEGALLGRLLHIGNRTARALLKDWDLAVAEKLAALGLSAGADLGDDDPGVLAVRSTLGRTLAAQGRNSEAERIYREVLTRQQDVLGGQHPETLQTRKDLAEMTEYQGRSREAADMCSRLVADARQALGDDAPLTLAARDQLAWVTAILGDCARAEEMLRQLLTDRRRVLGERHPDVLRVVSELAWCSGRLGRYEEAERQFRRLLDQKQKLLGEDHPSIADTEYRLARALTDQGRYREAEVVFRKALAARSRIQGDDHPVTSAARDNLARVLGLTGRYEEAQALFRQALADRERRLGPRHPHTITTRHRLAHLLASQQNYAEAEEMFRHVLADRIRILSDDHPNTSSTRYRLAEVLASQGMQSEAEELLRRALADREHVLGPGHPETVTARDRLTDLARTSGA